MSNKIILFALPGVAFPVIVTPAFESEAVMYETQIFYTELESLINPIVQEYNVDEVMVAGPLEYAQGIAKTLSNCILNDNVTIFAQGVNND